MKTGHALHMSPPRTLKAGIERNCGIHYSYDFERFSTTAQREIKMSGIGRRDVLRCLGSTAATLFIGGQARASRDTTDVTRAKLALPEQRLHTAAKTTGPVALDAQGDFIVAARFSADGSRVGAVADTTVSVWDAATRGVYSFTETTYPRPHELSPSTSTERSWHPADGPEQNTNRWDQLRASRTPP